MRLSLLDTMITCAYSLAGAVIGLGLVRMGGVTPLLGFSAGGLFLILAADLHGAVRTQRKHDALARKVSKVQDDLREFKRAVKAELAASGSAEADKTETRERNLMSEMKVLEDMIQRLSEQDRAPDPYAASTAAPEAAISREERLSAVRGALEHNRVDLYLQPIVSLPQRRVRFYESFTRMRRESGEIIMPGEFLAVAREAGLLTTIDNLLLFRCVQIVRRLAQKERRVGVFCNLSMDSLSDPEFFPRFMEFMRSNADLSSSLVFEIRQADFEGRSLEAARGIARLADFGFRFSIDNVQHLDADFGEMKRAGVRFFKAPGRLLAEAVSDGGEIGGIAVEDYAANLARYGVELIADKIEDEATVVEVLEFDVALGQGHLFGEPRPIRDEAAALTAAPMAAASAVVTPLRQAG